MTNETILKNSKETTFLELMLVAKLNGFLTLSFFFLTLLFLILYFFRTVGEENIGLVCDISQAACSLAAFVAALKISRNTFLDDETKKAWQRVTLAFFSYACGHVLWFYLNSVLGEPPFPSVADIGFSGFYPLMLWALRSFPTAPQTGNDKKKFWLDACAVMVSGLVLVWHFIIQPTIDAGEDNLKIALNLIYVVGDLVLFLGIITILLKKPKEISRRSLYAIILGLFSIGIADIGFAYSTLQSTSPTESWTYAFFTVGCYFMIIAAFIQQQRTITSANEIGDGFTQSSKFSWLPYIAIGIGYAMLLIVSQPYWFDPTGEFIFATLIISALMVMRQIISVKENIRLVEENSSKKSELRLKYMLENSSEITIIFDEKGNFEYLSPSVEKVLGHSNNKLIGSNLYDIVHPNDKRGIVKAYYENATTYNKNINIEYRLQHLNGSWHDMDGIAQLFFDEDTKTNRILMNARDVTARKRNEIQLREYTRKLQLSNRELQDFAFVASHDLQEPLRKVQAFSDRLASKFSSELGANGLDYLQRMQGASHRMQNLITDLLSFSRITTQAKPFVKSDLNKIISEVISDLEIKIEETNAQIVIEDLPNFDMETIQMRQLFQNLIGNALKFSRPDISPIIKIWSEVSDQDANNIKNTDYTDSEELTADIPQNHCRIFVEDNGIGFDEKYLDRIFTVFQRLHGRAEYEGSGVGLAVCRKIVERHNGHLTAKSEPNCGATFIITLPLTQLKPLIQQVRGENNEP
jgi:PAS domain S-box-containing protein